MSVPARAARASPDASKWTSTPAAESLCAARSSAGVPRAPASQPITSSPRARNVSAAATPERASPTIRYGPPGSGGRGFEAAAGIAGRAGRLPPDAELVDDEPDRPERGRDDPEAQDDLCLRPRLELEMVVDGRHQEHPLAEDLEREDLDDHREHLDHEDAPQQDEEGLRVGHDRQPGD